MFSLFNLQGTPAVWSRLRFLLHRRFPARRGTFLLYHKDLHLSTTFFKFFHPFLGKACISYQLPPPLSTPFFSFFRVFFSTLQIVVLPPFAPLFVGSFSVVPQDCPQRKQQPDHSSSHRQNRQRQFTNAEHRHSCQQAGQRASCVSQPCPFGQGAAGAGQCAEKTEYAHGQRR